MNGSSNGNGAPSIESRQRDAGRLDVMSRKSRRIAFVALRGDLDLSTVAQASRALHDVEQLDPGVIVLDIGDVEFMDSQAVHLLVDAQRRAQRDARHLWVIRPSPMARRILDICSQRDALNVFPDGFPEVRANDTEPLRSS